jgi:hypothetical protein
MSFDSTKFDLPAGWKWLEAEAIQKFEAELKKELHPDHSLYQVPLTAMASHQSKDDVLFRHSKHSDQFSVVHLTWSKKKERRGYPTVAFEGSYSEFLEACGNDVD